MAEKVARWRDDYGIDGIDLDLEEGAGSKKAAGPNMVHFTRRLKSLQPDLLVSQPTYGYPQVQAEIDVINASWQPGGASNGLADTIGLMVYEGAQALLYIKNYAAGSEQWQGFPIKVADSLSPFFSLPLFISLHPAGGCSQRQDPAGTEGELQLAGHHEAGQGVREAEPAGCDGLVLLGTERAQVRGHLGLHGPR